MIGDHFIKGWPRTQNHVTTSSAEAEIIALVKCTAESLGIKSMAQDWGQDLTVTLYADSSVALAIAKRKGAGKLRHINVSALWIQDIENREGAQDLKIEGTKNPADLMTKCLVREKMDACMRSVNQELKTGRAKVSLDVQGASTREGSDPVVQTKAGGVRTGRIPVVRYCSQWDPAGN